VFFVNLIVLACLFAFHLLYLLLFVLLAVLNKWWRWWWWWLHRTVEYICNIRQFTTIPCNDFRSSEGRMYKVAQLKWYQRC